MKDTARIMISPKCNKACSYCCNEQQGVLDMFKPVTDLQFLARYKNICITGGEPMLFPDKVLSVAAYARNMDLKVYLYTAQYTFRMYEVIKWLDGLTYTVHANANYKEVNDFYRMQALLATSSSLCHSKKLLKDPDVDLKISPVWADTEIAVWKKQCTIPENEDFYWYQA